MIRLQSLPLRVTWQIVRRGRGRMAALMQLLSAAAADRAELLRRGGDL